MFDTLEKFLRRSPFAKRSNSNWRFGQTDILGGQYVRIESLDDPRCEEAAKKLRFIAARLPKDKEEEPDSCPASTPGEMEVPPPPPVQEQEKPTKRKARVERKVDDLAIGQLQSPSAVQTRKPIKRRGCSPTRFEETQEFLEAAPPPPVLNPVRRKARSLNRVEEFASLPDAAQIPPATTKPNKRKKSAQRKCSKEKVHSFLDAAQGKTEMLRGTTQPPVEKRKKPVAVPKKKAGRPRKGVKPIQELPTKVKPPPAKKSARGYVYTLSPTRKKSVLSAETFENSQEMHSAPERSKRTRVPPKRFPIEVSISFLFTHQFFMFGSL